MNRHAWTLVVVLLSAGCGSKSPVERGAGIASQEMAFADMAPPQARAGYVGGAGGGAPTSANRTGLSQPVDPISYLAYAYGMSLELPGDRLIGVMEGHAAACRDAGLRVCQLVASRREGDPRDTLRGSLSLRAEPQWLQRFMKSVQSDALGAAGRVTAQWTTTEDLTREIVDTEATLRARRALRDRLQQSDVASARSRARALSPGAGHGFAVPHGAPGDRGCVRASRPGRRSVRQRRGSGEPGRGLSAHSSWLDPVRLSQTVHRSIDSCRHYHCVVMLSPKPSAPRPARLRPPQQFCRSCGSQDLERGEAVGTIRWFNCRACGHMWTQSTSEILVRSDEADEPRH
jgi:Domain of unknown function (DUF4349)